MHLWRQLTPIILDLKLNLAMETSKLYPARPEIQLTHYLVMYTFKAC